MLKSLPIKAIMSILLFSTSSFAGQFCEVSDPNVKNGKTLAIKIIPEDPKFQTASCFYKVDKETIARTKNYMVKQPVGSELDVFCRYGRKVFSCGSSLVINSKPKAARCQIEQDSVRNGQKIRVSLIGKDRDPDREKLKTKVSFYFNKERFESDAGRVKGLKPGSKVTVIRSVMDNEGEIDTRNCGNVKVANTSPKPPKVKIKGKLGKVRAGKSIDFKLLKWGYDPDAGQNVECKLVFRGNGKSFEAEIVKMKLPGKRGNKISVSAYCKDRLSRSPELRLGVYQIKNSSPRVKRLILSSKSAFAVRLPKVSFKPALYDADGDELKVRYEVFKKRKKIYESESGHPIKPGLLRGLGKYKIRALVSDGYRTVKSKFAEFTFKNSAPIASPCVVFPKIKNGLKLSVRTKKDFDPDGNKINSWYSIGKKKISLRKAIKKYPLGKSFSLYKHVKDKKLKSSVFCGSFQLVNSPPPSGKLDLSSKSVRAGSAIVAKRKRKARVKVT